MKTLLVTIFSAVENEAPATYGWRELSLKLVFTAACIYILVMTDSAVYNYLTN